MATKEFNHFMRHLVLAAKKHPELKASEMPKSSAKQSPKKAAKKEIKSKSKKKITKAELAKEIEKIEAKLYRVISKEKALEFYSKKDYKAAGWIRERVDSIQDTLLDISVNDHNAIEGIKKQIRHLEHECTDEQMRGEELRKILARIEEMRQSISEIKEKISRSIQEKAERERRIAELEQKIRKEAKDNRQEIEQIEEELANLRHMEEAPKPTIMEKLSAVFRKKSKVEDFVKPEEKELFEEKIPPQALHKKAYVRPPIITPRPLVKHDIFFEEARAKPGIPKHQKLPELIAPPIPPLLSSPKKKGKSMRSS